jgi:NADPH2:quinone reductase
VRAIVVEQFGGPEVLGLVEDAPEPTVGPGMALLEVAHAGINFADTHQAENSYLAPTSLPLVPRSEEHTSELQSLIR